MANYIIILLAIVCQAFVHVLWLVTEPFVVVNAWCSASSIRIMADMQEFLAKKKVKGE